MLSTIRLIKGTKMSGITYEATVVNGEIRLPAGIELPENSKVLIVVPNEKRELSGRLRSPRLADSERAAEFNMEIEQWRRDGSSRMVSDLSRS